MERFNKPLVALIVVFGAIVLAAMFADMWYSRRGFEPALDNPQVLRVYAVPAERAQDIRTALAATLDNGAGKAAPLGRVMLSGTNQLVVLAPLSTQESIAKAIERLGGAGLDPNRRQGAAPAAVRISVWIVDATGASGDDDEALAPLAEALAAARPAIGESSFRLQDTLVVSTITNGGNARVTSGRGTQVDADLRPGTDGVIAELKVFGRGDAGSIQTTTSLPFGKYVVLAQIAGQGGTDAPGEGRPRLYIVRAEPAG